MHDAKESGGAFCIRLDVVVDRELARATGVRAELAREAFDRAGESELVEAARTELRRDPPCAFDRPLDEPAQNRPRALCLVRRFACGEIDFQAHRRERLPEIVVNVARDADSFVLEHVGEMAGERAELLGPSGDTRLELLVHAREARRGAGERDRLQVVVAQQVVERMADERRDRCRYGHHGEPRREAEHGRVGDARGGHRSRGEQNDKGDAPSKRDENEETRERRHVELGDETRARAEVRGKRGRHHDRAERYERDDVGRASACGVRPPESGKEPREKRELAAAPRCEPRSNFRARIDEQIERPRHDDEQDRERREDAHEISRAAPSERIERAIALQARRGETELRSGILLSNGCGHGPILDHCPRMMVPCVEPSSQAARCHGKPRDALNASARPIGEPRRARTARSASACAARNPPRAHRRDPRRVHAPSTQSQGFDHPGLAATVECA